MIGVGWCDRVCEVVWVCDAKEIRKGSQSQSFIAVDFDVHNFNLMLAEVLTVDIGVRYFCRAMNAV